MADFEGEGGRTKEVLRIAPVLTENCLQKNDLTGYLRDLGRLHFFFKESNCCVSPMESNCRKRLIKWLSQQISAARRFCFLIRDVERKRFNSASSHVVSSHQSCFFFILYINMFALSFITDDLIYMFFLYM